MNRAHHASVVISPITAATSSLALRCGRQPMLYSLVARAASSGMHFCCALESRRRNYRIPGLESLSASVRDNDATTASSSPVFDFFRKRQTSNPAASATTSAQPSQHTPDSTRPEHHRRQHSRHQLRRSRTPHDTKDSVTTEPYVFPVGRALRYVELGRRYHDQTEGQADLHKWLAGMHFSPSADAARQLLGSWSDGVGAPANSETPVYGPAHRAEVSAFAKRHAHHVLVEFKVLRRQLTEAQSRVQAVRRGSQRPADSSRENRYKHGADGSVEELSASSSTRLSPPPSLSPHPLPVRLAAALTQSLFNATVLLHVSGLFGVADTHVERLLDVCFSTSIFLAQDAAATATATGTCRQRSHLPALSSSTEAPQQNSAAASVVEPPTRSCHLHSLHWAIVHFAAGVQHWGLLDHTSPLQDVGRTQRPYERLLQVHAALLCEQTRRCVDHVLWHELVLLKSGRRAEAARNAWFMGPDAAAYSALFGAQSSSSASCDAATEEGSLARRVPPRLQQRRLQLLPLLWLSLLCSQLQKRQTPAIQTSPTFAAPCRGPSRPDGGEVTWATARHALTALLPLFSKDARLDVTTWAAVHLLFLPQRGHLPSAKDIEAEASQACTISPAAATTNASLTELCALLARVEHDGAMLELGVVLPGPVGTCAETSAYFHLASFLRRWLDATTAPPPVSSSRGTAHVGLVGSRRSIRGGSSALAAVQTPIRTARQLYRALLNIPLSTLYLPSPAPSSSDVFSPSATSAEHALAEWSREQPLSVTAEGVCLLNQMLLRALLQWRGDCRVRRVPQSSDCGGMSEVFVPEKYPSASGVASVESECSWGPRMPWAARTGSRGHTEATGAAQSDSPPGALPTSTPAIPKAVIVSAAESRLQWEQELVCVLKATLHLAALINVGAGESVSSDGSSDRSAALIRALVAPTAQTAARALAEQLGVSLLPWRLLLLHFEHVSLTAAELQLLDTLDATLRHVLVLSSPRRVHGSDAESATPSTSMGALPTVYRVSMNALTRTAT
ncbi:hypothetical protein Q4I28_006697 [Leishmania naiffi]|uniref:Uncharacterized protein n=1 Tax=Leishmania naiffi TaxID=5678 RepID=A0AAW3B9T7_9TRYP